ncbi:YolD-like family protein [Niallia circulans]|nr:YolD-like family protein [Niallia circulans]
MKQIGDYVKEKENMILKELARNRKLVINYYKNGLLQTCKGSVELLNLHEQTLNLKDEKENILQIKLSWIHDIAPTAG